MLEPVEAALDAIAQLVKGEVVRDRGFSGRIAGDDRAGAKLCGLRPQGVAVVGLVGEDMPGLEACDQCWSLRGIAGLSWGQDDAQRSAQSIGCQMDLVVNPPRERPRA